MSVGVMMGEEDVGQSPAALGERREGRPSFGYVGCNLCYLACPVDGCITMVRQETGAPAMTWEHHPNNPLRKE